MKYLIIICVLVFPISAQFTLLKSLSEDEIKVRVAKILKTLRANKKWMSIDACPFNRIMKNGRRPNFNSGNCAANPELCLEKCNAKDADACYFLANLIQDYDKIESDVADVLYQRSCELGLTSGCTNRAANIFNRNTVTGNACASRTFEKTCSQDDPWGCTMFGFILSEGIGRKKNVGTALTMFSKACEVSIDKNAGACKRANELGQLIERSQNSN